MAGGGDVEGWPLDRIRARYDPSRSNPKAVLVATGAMNPVHLGHIDMMVRAKACLEGYGFDVLGGFISPSHDTYVGPKCRQYQTAFEQASTRVALVRASVQHTGWLEAGSWESDPRHQCWPDFPVVCASLRDRLDSVLPSRVSVMYVCGMDHFQNCQLGRGMHVERIPRAGVPPPPSVPDRDVYGCTEVNFAVEHISSSAVRKAIKDGSSLVGMVPECVITVISELDAYRS